ncbi:hypothetical protein H7849_03425 [Alloacidobacterium dinghuense]|uniref:Glycosyltransferase RgtA/B/C/D-like domain-containing protein n=1 Tax=Alloacidobacterium dinghuense TaxID=2763107 RepID=A0A7G8BKH0_9BACT|nr:hypothetical protein [Alloacidobacterium dinghuense]QNI33040.1 hypothetical protein H7849_03425 [Alloacidobacterium dinghuense]
MPRTGIAASAGKRPACGSDSILFPWEVAGVLMWQRFSFGEKIVLLLGLFFWLAFSIYAAPVFGGTDTFLFRDAACNLLHGQGFSTASFEHSHSFRPLLYASYTPLTQWTFLIFAALWHCRPATATLYNFVIAIAIDLAVLGLIVRRMQPGLMRTVAIVLIAVTLPVGYMGIQAERPEYITFLLLLLLLIALRSPLPLGRLVGCSIIASLAFLAEPIGGVFGSALIGGAIVLGRNGLQRKSVGGVVSRLAISAIAFLIPIGIVVGVYQHKDHASVARFIHQAKVGGLSRKETDDGRIHSADLNNGSVAPTDETHRLGAADKYVDALRFIKALGPLQEGVELSAMIVVLIWLVLLVRSKGNRWSIAALAFAGLVLFVAVFGVFPLQPNYLVLTRSLFPFVLLFDWAGCRGALRTEKVIEIVTVLNLIVLLPGLLLVSLMRLEGRESYLVAQKQVALLKSYLTSHTAQNNVVLAPSTHYYLYKEAFPNLYNPSYLSSQHDMSQVVAIANCDTASPFFIPGTKPLPEGVNPTKFKLFDSGSPSVSVTLLHRKLMSKNWTWSCDLYVSKSLEKPQ